MIVFTDIQDQDMITRFIDKEDLVKEFSLDGNYFGCIEGDDLIGLCKVQIKAKELILVYMHFSKEYKLLELESALLKSMLFRFEDLDYKDLFSLQKNENLNKLGFKEIDGDYKLTLKEFLVSTCSCGHNADE